jgi:hypothetical protein
MPALSSNDNFQKVLAIAESQLKNKKIQVRFGPQGKMRFIIDEDGLRAALSLMSSPPGLSEETFREIFDNEVGPLLEAVLRDAVDQFIDTTAIRDEDQKDRKPILKRRAELVNTALVNEELRARFLIKTSSKHPRLRATNWEVVRKLALSNRGSISRAYATLNFETVRPDMPSAFLWFPFFSDPVGQSTSVSFDCDEGDLDDLIQTLQDARSALTKTAT